jgi:hypothetical protein
VHREAVHDQEPDECDQDSEWGNKDRQDPEFAVDGSFFTLKGSLFRRIGHAPQFPRTSPASPVLVLEYDTDQETKSLADRRLFDGEWAAEHGVYRIKDER